MGSSKKLTSTEQDNWTLYRLTSYKITFACENKLLIKSEESLHNRQISAGVYIAGARFFLLPKNLENVAAFSKFLCPPHPLG